VAWERVLRPPGARLRNAWHLACMSLQPCAAPPSAQRCAAPILASDNYMYQKLGTWRCAWDTRRASAQRYAALCSAALGTRLAWAESVGLCPVGVTSRTGVACVPSILVNPLGTPTILLYCRHEFSFLGCTYFGVTCSTFTRLSTPISYFRTRNVYPSRHEHAGVPCTGAWIGPHYPSIHYPTDFIWTTRTPIWPDQE
jgi:hypothetical protein